MNDSSEKQTLVEEGTEFTGTLKAKCKVVVRGTIDGQLEAPSVSITPTGAVTGNVKADRVESNGVLSGEVDADDIALSGEVRSNTRITAKSLSVNLSSDKGKLEVTFGDCVLDVGEMPSDQPADDVQTGKKKGKKGKNEANAEPEPAAPEGAPRAAIVPRSRDFLPAPWTPWAGPC